MKLSTIINKNQGLKSKIQDKLVSKENSTIKTSQSLSTNLSSNKSEIISLNKNQNISSKDSISIKNDNLDIQGNNLTRIIKTDNTKLIPSNCSSEVSIVNDKIIQGGYRVVQTIQERNQIDCCFRKLGMVVIVVGPELDFKEYTIHKEDKCDNSNWEEVTIYDESVLLTDDYSDLDLEQEIKTQRDLNKVFKQILESLNYVGNVDKHYTHDQFIPASVWEINHNLGKKPSVTITDTAGSVIEGKVTLNNGTKITIEFNFPFSGYAELN